MIKELITSALMAILAAFILTALILYGGPTNDHHNNSPVGVVFANSTNFSKNNYEFGSSSSGYNNKTVLGSNNNSNKRGSIFIIGDSTVDCGENTLFYPLIKHNLSLYPCSNVSDSSLVPHFIAEKMGLPEIPTFYEQNGTIEGIMYGLNFGSAQATILTNSNGPSFQSLNQQLRQAFETIQLLQLQLGQTKAEQFINSSIFYLSLGKDDYLNFFFPNNFTSLDFTGDGQAFSRMLVDEMTRALRNLYDAGVKRMVYMGVLPLGCAPRVVVDWYFTRGRNARSRSRGCVNEINQLIMQHNQHLSERILDLNLEYPDARFVFCDAYSTVMQILAHPRRHGFSDVRAACCGEGWHGAAVGCQSMEEACSNSSSHVWWDFYNPTEAVNTLLANSAWSGQPFDDMCRPYTVQGLADASS